MPETGDRMIVACVLHIMSLHINTHVPVLGKVIHTNKHYYVVDFSKAGLDVDVDLSAIVIAKEQCQVIEEEE